MGICEKQYHIIVRSTDFGVRLIGSDSGLCDLKLILCAWIMHSVYINHIFCIHCNINKANKSQKTGLWLQPAGWMSQVGIGSTVSRVGSWSWPMFNCANEKENGGLPPSSVSG